MFERDAVENYAAAEVDELAPAVVVDGKEEYAVGGHGDSGNVGGGLAREG